MAKISVYLNSHSSQGHSTFNEVELKKFFFRHELEVKSTSSLEELNESISDDVKNGTQYIFAAGGDGTMNAVSQSLINKNIKLMILPAGTANDFAKELGLTNNLKKISLDDCLKRSLLVYGNQENIATAGKLGMT